MATHEMTKAENEILKLKKYEHIMMGIDGLDYQHGLTNEDFLLIAGGSGSGKSTIALSIACTMAKAGHTIVFINYEVSPKVLVDSMAALGFNYDIDFGTLDNRGQNRLKLISPIKGMSFNEIVKAVQLYKPKALFIDLFNGLLSGIVGIERNNLTLKYATELSFFPQKYNCAVIVTEQLVKDNKVGRPTLNDVQGASSLVHKATRVITIYRYKNSKLNEIMKKDYYPSNTNDLVMALTTEIIVRKDRLGIWASNINLIKYQKNIGFIGLDEHEISTYNNTAFGMVGK